MKKIDPEWIKEFLMKRGRSVSLDEAKLIYEWMKHFADISVRQYLRQ